MSENDESGSERGEETPWSHVSFKYPVRVVLQGKSTPLIAVTGKLFDHGTNEVKIFTKQIYQALTGAGTAITSSGVLLVSRDNIAGRLLLKELPK